MDRTIIGSWKAEEKELGERLNQKFQGLFLLFSPSEDLRRCVSDEMFLKPNQHAFFQVMHYLFRLLDPSEFRKRFYWPVTDKRGEANFRSSTIEYWKHLNEKHHLQWTNIKSYLVVMPGGMKFINFMLDFVAFVVLELTRQREKQLTADAEFNQVSSLNLKRMRQQNIFFKEYVSAYIVEVDEHIEKLRQKTELIKSEILKIADEIELNMSQMAEMNFLIEFESSNRMLFQHSLTESGEKMSALEDPLMKLKQAIENFQSKETEAKTDSKNIHQALRRIGDMFPLRNEEMQAIEGTLMNAPNIEDIQMGSLISAFNCIFPKLNECLNVTNEKSLSNEFVATQLMGLQNDFEQIELQITDFQKILNSNIKKRSFEQKHNPVTPAQNKTLLCPNEENKLLMKFICTPPIRLEMTESSRAANMRLPLCEDFYTRAINSSFNNSILTIPLSARKTSIRKYNSALDLNGTMKNSKIIDPVQLLRTVNRETSRSKPRTQYKLSGLGSKWKERQSLLKTEETPNAPQKITEVTATFEQLELSATLAPSPYTPCSMNERTCIARAQTLLNLSYSGDVGADVSVGNSTSLFYGKKLSAVKKVQNASLNFQNLSTSPSGRLEFLGPVDAKEVLLPNLKINDITLDTSNANEMKNRENTKFNNINCDDDEDDLCNISDTVLKDITL